MTEEQNQQEPPDHHNYIGIMLYRDSFFFFLYAVKFYETLIEKDIKTLEADPDLKTILDGETIHSLEIHHDFDRARRVRVWMEKLIAEKGPDSFDFDLPSISHELIRFFKSAGILYLKHLKAIRNALATKPNLSRHALQAVDTRISEFEGKIEMGVFHKATPFPLLVEDTGSEEHIEGVPEVGEQNLNKIRRPRPVVLDSIQLLDKELRERCLDLFHAFQEDGKKDRLDTVITEATRILESRLRLLSHAQKDCVGVDLATYAFKIPKPVLKISDIPSEQEAVYLLYRGVFGFIRNRAHHQLMGELLPERVLQILGLIDYLLQLAEGAEKKCEDTNDKTGASSS